ncbi:MAG: leucine-rich repeat domain-containing protein [Christensenellales bacterium]
MKRVMIVTLALLLLAALYPTTTVHAEEALTSGDFEYHVLEDGTAEITWYKGSAESLEIPGKLNGLAVTSIGDRAFSERKNLKSITIPDSVTSIGDWAFYGCSSLKEITIPESVTCIGEMAFYGCENLTNISIPDSVTNLGYNPFAYCKNLNRVTVHPDHPAFATIDGVLFNKADKRLIWYPMPREDTVYEIPQGIQSIGDGAFSWCENLTSISIPDSVTSIGDWAFSGCENLTSISIPDSVTSIGKMAFYWCSSLKKVIVAPDSYAQKYCKERGLPFVYQENANQMND